MRSHETPPRTGEGGQRRRRAARVGGVVLVLLSAVPGTILAQEGGSSFREIGLDDALALARRGNVAFHTAGAREEGARARARRATAELFPHLDLESGWVRTVDPVAAFGTKLRQGVFATEDLSIPVLNDPDALDDWTTSAVVRWNVASPRRWAARAGAEHGAEAEAWSARRVRETTLVETRILYYRAVQEGARTDAAVAAERAARATLERFERRREEGMLTEADVLQARSELEAAAADVVAAERARYDARLILGLHLGWGPDTVAVPTDPLGEPRAPQAEPGDLRTRADLRAREKEVDVARAGRVQARLGWAPSLEVVSSYALRGDAPFSDQGTDWTTAVALRWNLFSGMSRTAQTREASARLDVAELQYEQALRAARSEVRMAQRATETALRRVEATRAAREAARSGRDLMRRRFEEGLATPSDLLQAEARAAAMEVRAVDALVDFHVARARLHFVRGDPASVARPEGEATRPEEEGKGSHFEGSDR